jgi:hypothetical protein
MTVTGTPGTGTITLNAASSGYQTFANAYGADATVDILVVDGTAWEVARNCAYTNSGTTVTRGTLEASSTGSAISLTSAAVVSVIATADRGRTWDAAALEHVTASPTTADPTVTVNTMHFLDVSGLTADRNFTLPATAAVGDRVGVYITTGDDAYELIVKANTGDTLNGVSAAEWSRLFITGECLVMRCITANAAWIVEYDGRIPMKAMMSAASSQTGIATATETTVTQGASGSWAEDIDVGDIIDAANNAIKVRRACKAVFTGGFPFSSLNDQTQCYAAARINSGTARRFTRGATSNTATNIWSGSGSIQLNLAADDSVTMRVLQNQGSNAASEWVSATSMAFLSIVELIP